MSIAENIKHIRKLKGMTQKQLAEKSGLAVITIQQYEAGKYEPKNNSLYKLRKALDCNINELIEMPFDLMPSIPNPIIINDLNELDKLPEKIKQLKLELEAEKEVSNDKNIALKKYLLLQFDELNDKGKNKLTNYAEDLTKIPEYQKKDE